MENPAVTDAVIEATKKILTELSNRSSIRVDKAADFLTAVLQPYFESVYKAGVEAQLRTLDRRPEDPQGERIGRDLGKVERYDPPSKIDHPAHYGGDTVYEAIKVIEAWGLNFSLGSAVKYICRAGKKENEPDLDDLKKAAWYLNREIERRSK